MLNTRETTVFAIYDDVEGLLKDLIEKIHANASQGCLLTNYRGSHPARMIKLKIVAEELDVLKPGCSYCRAQTKFMDAGGCCVKCGRVGWVEAKLGDAGTMLDSRDELCVGDLPSLETK